MTVTCTINFENNSSKVFYSGQLIRGNVRLALTERIKVRGVYIRFNGDANTEWSEYVQEEQGSGDDRKSVNVLKHYQSHENYLNSKIFLVGGNSDAMYLEAGEYIYDFGYRLPTNIPSSFNGTYGNIKYKTTVVLVIPWWIDDKFNQTITIIKRVDLNDNPTLHRPVTMAKEHNYYPCGLLCCFPSDPLKIIVKVPVGGYVSGQTIKLTLTADNESNRRIPSFKTELIKNITYYAENEIKTERFFTTGEQSNRGVETNQKRVIYLNLRIPSYRPSDVTACGIIKIRYYIVIKADSGTMCNKPKIEMPITIGTHAINNLDDKAQSGLDNNPSTSVVTVQPSAPQKDDLSNEREKSASAPSYPADDQPNYTIATIESVPYAPN